MLHTKFRENRPTGSGEEDFRRVFTIYGHGGHLGHVTSTMSSDFHFLVPESFHTKFNYYTPGIYADGYIVFAFPFVRSSVRMFVSSFVLPSRSWNLRQSFALKFLKWSISQQLHIRKHSYLDHSYPGWLAFTP